MTLFEIAFFDDAVHRGHIWRVDEGRRAKRLGWSTYGVEPTGALDVMVYSGDFPSGVSISCLLENLKRVRANEAGLKSLMERIAEEPAVCAYCGEEDSQLMVRQGAGLPHFICPECRKKPTSIRPLSERIGEEDGA